MNHCVKRVQIRSFFWSVFSCIRTEYGGKIRTRRTPYLVTFYAVNRTLVHFSKFKLQQYSLGTLTRQRQSIFTRNYEVIRFSSSDKTFDLANEVTRQFGNRGFEGLLIDELLTVSVRKHSNQRHKATHSVTLFPVWWLLMRTVQKYLFS